MLINQLSSTLGTAGPVSCVGFRRPACGVEALLMEWCQDPEAGEPALAELKAIQFGILSNDDTLAFSVFEKNQSIDSSQNFWSSRLGVYDLLSKGSRCSTCGASRALKCDGHFGHIKLPMPVYHPLHVRYIKDILSKICLVCLRYRGKKEPKKTRTTSDEAVAKELLNVQGKLDCTHGDESHESQSQHEEEGAKKVRKFKSQGNSQSMDTGASILESPRSHETEALASRGYSLKRSRPPEVEAVTTKLSSPKALNRDVTEGLVSKIYSYKSCGNEFTTKACFGKFANSQTVDGLASNLSATRRPSRLEVAYRATKGATTFVDLSFDDIDSPSGPLGVKRGNSLKVKQAKQVIVEEYQKVNSLISGYGVSKPELSDTSESSGEVGCKYCGADLKDPENRYPELKVISTKKDSALFETIEMKVNVKNELVPPDYWDFVDGHPGSLRESRPLFPFEALKILKRIPGEVIQKLGMHELVAKPEALILCTLPVPPSGSRVKERLGKEKSSNSYTAIPQVHMDQQHRLLQAVLKQVQGFQRSRTGKPNFAEVKSEVMKLQSVVAHYLAGSKMDVGMRPTFVEPEIKNDDKMVKGHVLAKMNINSVRLVVVGDPSIKIEEISVPIDLVDQLTVPENVTAFNIEHLQQYVENGAHADFFRTGAVRVDRGRQVTDLFSTSRRVALEIGDVVHRHLREGDLIIVNRSPTLQKHGLMGLRVRFMLHLGSACAVNPLICAPFQADFDGDCMHIFVPQSTEVLAEVRELMNVPSQLINPQCGQSNSILTEDSRLGAYLLTSSCVFLHKTEMNQLTMWHSLLLPIPAIVKSPKAGPLWTGQQLYSMAIPAGTNCRVTHKRFTHDEMKGFYVRNGEILFCDGGSYWLEDAVDALAVSISNMVGPTAALEYLNNAQVLSNQWLSTQGFSVGLQDYHVARDAHSRGQMLHRMREELVIANREALLKMIISDPQVQMQELRNHPMNRRGFSVDTQCNRSCGLFLGHVRSSQVQALQKVAISEFQSKYSRKIECLARDYGVNGNSLMAMINAGSKGSMSKLVQQTVSLGLQLCKGEDLLAPGKKLFPCCGPLMGSSTFKITDLLQLEQGVPAANLCGYWESRGIVPNSYLDGLRPLQFFLHNIASRYGLLRAGVEEPNVLLKRLLLFMRDLHVGYDGAVRNLQDRHIVQFEYGGLLELEGEDKVFKQKYGPDDWPDAGEAVGILAATSITEPAYQLKLDSPHMVGAKAIGPLQLIKETLYPRSSVQKLEAIDRRIILRFPSGLRNRQHGQEKGATRVQQLLKPVTLDMVMLTTVIKYQKMGTEGRDLRAQERRSPWVGHIQLSLDRLMQCQVKEGDIALSLEKKYPNLVFHSSDDICLAAPSPSKEQLQPCLQFFPVVQDISMYDDMDYEGYMSGLLQAMKDVMQPLLDTTIKGDDRIESLNIIWEEKAWSPPLGIQSVSPVVDQYMPGNGELVVEVTFKEKYCKNRGNAWDMLKEACLPIMQLLDWNRSTPYSVQEVQHCFGVEAANKLLIQRLGLAAAGMGKPLASQHLKLIADAITFSGEVTGATLLGYIELCRRTSSSAPFQNAAFMNHKTKFLEAARVGASEQMEGALTGSVWGKPASVGTGSDFDLHWQNQITAEPLSKLEKGMDIHESFAKLSSLRPPERPTRKSMPVLHYLNDLGSPGHISPPVTKPTTPPLHPVKARAHGIESDRYKNLRGESWRESRNAEHPQRLNRLTERVCISGSTRSASRTPESTLDISLASGSPSGASKLCSAALAKRSRLFADLDQPLKEELSPTRRGGGVTQREVVHEKPAAELERVVQKIVDIKSQTSPSLTKPPGSLHICIEDDGDDSRIGSPEGSSSSFHTPKETLETHSATSSPCSSFREHPDPAALPEESTSEGDQLSSISQPAFPMSQAVKGKTSGGTMLDAKVIQSVCHNSEATGVFMSPFVQSSSRRTSNQQLRHSGNTTSAVLVSDIIGQQSAKRQEDWEDLLHLNKVIKAILHRRYKIGERLGSQHQRLIVNKVLPFHPYSAEKMGCGVHYIKVDHHASYSHSRCFYVVRTDKSVCDFSYHKCIKGIANAKSPALALQYDHEFLIRHGRDELFDDDILNYPGIDPLDIYPAWTSSTRPGGLVDDMRLLVSTNWPEGAAAGRAGADLPTEVLGGLLSTSNLNCVGSRPKSESSCETAEPGTRG